MIRSLTLEDRDVAVALWHACGLTRPWNDPRADYERALAGPASTVLGAFDEDGGALTGTAMVGHDGHRGWVYYLAVDPAHRGRRQGRALMAACEEWVRQRGIPKLDVMVREENAATRGFYEALGYELDAVVVYSRRF